MALDDRDPADLKLHVLLLLFRHPQGIRFGDFSAAFHQLHGCHPRISLYGYRSLRQLIADMEDMVVVEGSSQAPVMKFVKGFTLDNWMKEKNGLQSSAEEPWSLMNGEKAEKQPDASASSASASIQNLVEEPESQAPENLSDVLVAVSNLLAKYKFGLKVKKLQELLLAGYGIDLKKTSISHGYKDTLKFLKAQMPKLCIQYKGNHLSCVVQLPTEGLSDTLTAVTHILAKYKLGLKIKKLQELLLAQDGIDLEKFSVSHGYKDTLELLQVWMPELNIQYKENHLACVVQLLAGASVSSASSSIQNCGGKPAGHPPVPCIPAPPLESDASACSSKPAQSGQVRPKSGTSSPAPCLGTVFPTCNSEAVSQKRMEMKSDVTASSASNDIQNCVELPGRQAPELSIAFFLIRDVLQDQPHGLKVKKLKKALNENYKFNLETFRSDLGYKDVMSCLQDISGLLLQNVTKPKNCVVRLESCACSPAPSLDSDFSACSSDTMPEFGASSFAPCPDFSAFNTDAMPQKHIATSSAPTTSSCSTSSLFSVPPSFELKQSADTSKTQNQNRSPKKQARSRSASSKSSTSLSVNSERIASHSNNQTGTMSRKIPDVLALVSNLLAMYVSGLKVKKVQAILLATEGFDLEKYSIAHSYKDSLEFLERQMPQLTFRYGQDRLCCVVKNGSGSGDNAKPLSTSRSSSASKARDQSFPLGASSTIENGVHKHTSVVCPPNLPSWSTSHAKISVPSSAQLPKACQLNGPLPPDEVSSQVAIEAPRISSLIKDQPAKELEDVKRQVAHILAPHPEGMSLFQFRAAYSATYQQHLPLGNASSAKKWLLEMPDVVQLKGCGVQTLLLPVSSAAPSAQSGLPVSSTGMADPGHILSPATAVSEPPVALQPLSKSLEDPQHGLASFLTPDLYREPGNQEFCILPGVLPPTTQKTTDPWQERQRARDNTQDLSGQPGSSRVEKATVDPAISLAKASLAGAPKSCLKPSAPKTAAKPMPQPCLSLLHEQKTSKKCASFSQPLPQKAPLPVYPVQEHGRANPKPESISFPPQSPVFPAAPTSWDKNLKPGSSEAKSMHLTNHWSSSNTAPACSVSQPVSDSFQAWSQPVVYPPIAFRSTISDHPIIYPTPFLPTPVNPSQIQFPKPPLQSRTDVQKGAPMKPAQVIPPTYSTPPWAYILAVPNSNISQMPKPSGTLPPSAVVSPAGWPPLSPISKNTATSCLPKSEAVHQLACSKQDGLQAVSVPRAEEKLPDTTLGGVTSKPPSPMYPRHYNGADSLVTSSSTLPIRSHSLPSTRASLKPPYASSSVKNSNSALEPPAFLNHQQFTSVSTVPSTSDMGPTGSPPSPLDPTTSVHDRLLHPSSSSISNSDVRFSEPPSFIDSQPSINMNAVRTVSSTHPLSLPPYPLGSPSSPSLQASSATWRDGIDYGAPDQKNITPRVSNQTSSSSSSLSRRRSLTHSSPPDSPPPQSFDKCVIL